MQITTSTVGLALALAAAHTATADITSIGQFTGDASETFENIGPPQSYPGGMDVFNDQATFNDSLTDAPWISTVLNGPEGSIFPFDGNFMGLSTTGWAELTFDTPVVQIGGFLGSTNVNAGGEVTFFDEQGSEIETVSLEGPTTDWSWYGWQSDTPIASMTVNANANPGNPLAFDNWQATFIPAPGALALLGLGALVPRRRRR